jgi:disulfide bond formation protein DsbB
MADLPAGLRDRLPAAWPAVALAFSAFMLATAHAFERFGGYAPCLLCLKQREVYWVAGAVALVGIGLLRLPKAQSLRPWLALLIAAIFLFGAGLAAYHAGVEWKWWAGPDACSGVGGSVSSLNMAGLLDGTLKVRPPACDAAAWRLLGLSMAGWNALASLAFAGLGALAWRWEGKSP